MSGKEAGAKIRFNVTMTMKEIPAELASIEEDLKREGVYLNRNEPEVKPASQYSFEERAIRAVNEAFRQSLQLLEIQEDLSQAARIVEKIQVAAAEAERASFIAHTRTAKKCSHLSDKIAVVCRELLHELKEQRTRKKVA